MSSTLQSSIGDYLQRIALLLLISAGFWLFPMPVQAKKQTAMVFPIIKEKPPVQEPSVGPTSPPVVTPVKLATSPKPRVTKAVKSNSGSTWTFVPGNCTWYVANKIKITFSGNAKQWLINAAAAGYNTGQIPKEGAAVVTSTSGKYGHVAYVEQVGNDYIVISEMNYKGKGVVSTRTIPLVGGGIKGYIYSD